MNQGKGIKNSRGTLKDLPKERYKGVRLRYSLPSGL